MPNLHFSGSYFWFAFSLILLLLVFILVRKQLPHYVNHPYYPYVKTYYKWIMLVVLVFVLFGNFQLNHQPTSSTIRGFDNADSVKTEAINKPKEQYDVRGNFDKTIDKAKKDLDQ